VEQIARERKAQVVRIVERVAQTDQDDPEDAYRFGLEATDRLDHDDIYGCVMTHTVSELVAMICKDLGLDPDWPTLAQEAWAVEERGGGEVGWPLADQGPSPSGAVARLRTGERDEGGGTGPATTPDDLEAYSSTIERSAVPLHSASRGPPSPMGKDLKISVPS
jgi:hypothetical protein